MKLKHEWNLKLLIFLSTKIEIYHAYWWLSRDRSKIVIIIYSTKTKYKSKKIKFQRITIIVSSGFRIT